MRDRGTVARYDRLLAVMSALAIMRQSRSIPGENPACGDESFRIAHDI
jgi:hypothetical protein